MSRRPTIPVARLPKIAAKAGPTISRRKPRDPLLPMAEDPDDPLDESKYPGNPEGDAIEELEQLRTGFLERAKAEEARFKAATDTTYYTVLVFDDGAQCTAFLKAVGLDKERSGDMFIDGRLLAEKFGIELPKAVTAFNPTPRIDGKLKALVRKPGKA